MSAVTGANDAQLTNVIDWDLLKGRIDAVAFDMDGVLIDADRLHYDALNMALATQGLRISYAQHRAFFKGIPTRHKLRILETKHQLAPHSLDPIEDLKKKHTVELIESTLQPDLQKVDMLRALAANGIKVAVVSNSIRDSVERMLGRCGLLDAVDVIISNEDIERTKPAPDGYLAAFEKLSVAPGRTLIVEDSDVGRASARASGGILCAVEGPKDVTLERIHQCVRHIGKMRIVVPMAGHGSRFAQAGYNDPKPLIDVDGKPMIQRVVENIACDDAFFIFIVQAEHRRTRALDVMLRRIAPGCEIIEVPRVTEGAACTVLLAKNFIDDDHELLIANSDQLVDTGVSNFVDAMRIRRARGGMMTFRSLHPKWSFAKCDENGWVTEVREKVPISDTATVGIYWFAHGHDYVTAAESMIEHDDRVNGEFYVCPVYNYLIRMMNAGELSENGVKNGVKNGVATYDIDVTHMHGTGTPEDLNAYLNFRNTNPKYRKDHP